MLDKLVLSFLICSWFLLSLESHRMVPTQSHDAFEPPGANSQRRATLKCCAKWSDSPGQKFR
jgi:hypothetical protein